MALLRTRHIPERRCVACREKFPKRELTRIVRTSHGAVIVDPSGKTAGRGAYLCGSADCWQRGILKGGLERGLRSSIPPGDREALLALYPRQTAEPSPEG